MSRTLFLSVALSVVMTAFPAAAQNLTVEFYEGRVSVDATAVPVRTILTEWGKVGGTKIIGAEKITGLPLTVKLIDVTEAQALETILRSVAGYMAAPRNTGTGPSMYDRILVMATTTAPPPAARPTPATNNNAGFNGAQRFVPPRQVQQREQPEQDEEPEPDENPPGPPVFTFPPPGQNGFPNQPGQNINTPQNGGPAGTTVINPSTGAVIPPAQGQEQPQAPIGVARPGMMVAPPPQNQPNQPGMIRRPPGGGQ